MLQLLLDYEQGSAVILAKELRPPLLALASWEGLEGRPQYGLLFPPVSQCNSPAQIRIRHQVPLRSNPGLMCRRPLVEHPPRKKVLRPFAGRNRRAHELDKSDEPVPKVSVFNRFPATKSAHSNGPFSQLQ